MKRPTQRLEKAYDRTTTNRRYTFKTNYLHNHTLEHNEIVKRKENERENEDHTIYITTLLFIDFASFIFSFVLLDWKHF